MIRILGNHPNILPNVKDKDGWTALHIAADNSCLNTVQSLVEIPSISMNIKNNMGFVPFTLALNHNYNEEIYRFLLSRLSEDQLLGNILKDEDIDMYI